MKRLYVAAVTLFMSSSAAIAAVPDVATKLAESCGLRCC